MLKYIMIYLTKSPKETEKLAKLFIKKYLKRDNKRATVIALEGELGAGKTTFVRGLARELNVRAKIKSPTFTLMKKYSISSSKNYQLPISSFKFLYHLDCYRLRDHRDLKILGMEEILNDPGNIVLVEWSERVKKILLRNHIKVHIDHISKNERKITIK